MAAIGVQKPRLWNEPACEGLVTTVTPKVAETWEKGDILHIVSGLAELVIDADIATLANVCMAAHKFPDAYYEPVGTTPVRADVFRLQDVIVEMNMQDGEELDAADIGTDVELRESTANAGTLTVLQTATTNPCVTIIDAGDPIYGGDGVDGSDTGQRILVKFLDSVLL